MACRLFYAVAFLLLVSASAAALSAPSCGQIVADLIPCLPWLQGQDPSLPCCAGVKQMKSMAATKADKVAICNCAKPVLSAFTYDPKRLPVLPQKCGVALNIPPIHKNYDCSKVI